MLKRFTSSLFCLLTIYSFELPAIVVETQHIAQVLPFTQKNTLVLFNIAEVLTDSQITLGTSAWRRYVRKKAPQYHDKLTWLVASKVPHQSVENITPKLIADLQNRGIAVAALTSRGRSEWYSTEVQGVDELTEKLLNGMNIDFRLSQLPFVFIQMEDSYYLSHYRSGIFYANDVEDGDFLKKLIKDSGYRPSNVVFVNDKRDSLEEVDLAMEELNIPFIGLWYTKTAKDHQYFSPMVAHIQLQKLIFDDSVISDAEAQSIIDEQYPDVDPDQFFFDLLKEMDQREFVQ